MACACNKRNQEASAERKTQTAGIAARRTTAASATPTPAPTKTAAPMRGVQQSFSLQVGGKTVTYGSALERDAAAARTGGKII